MKRTMHGVTLNADIDSLLGQPIQVSVPKPGTIRQTLLTMKPTAVISATNPNAAPVELVPTILFEIDPDSEAVKRNFAILPGGKTIQSDNHLEYRGSFLYPDGRIFFLFEEMDEVADFVALAAKTFQGR